MSVKPMGLPVVISKVEPFFSLAAASRGLIMKGDTTFAVARRASAVPKLCDAANWFLTPFSTDR